MFVLKCLRLLHAWRIPLGILYSTRRCSYCMSTRAASFCDSKHELLWEEKFLKNRKGNRRWNHTDLGAGATGETWGTSSTEGTLVEERQVTFRSSYKLKDITKHRYLDDNFLLSSIITKRFKGPVLTAGPAGPTLPSAPRAPAGPAGPARPLSPGIPRDPYREDTQEGQVMSRVSLLQS